jgi:hypothetical protein
MQDRYIAQRIKLKAHGVRNATWHHDALRDLLINVV